MAGRPYPPGVLERLQKVENEILRVVDGICREHGITYFLLAGNLLGAVRHGGFIPWDDDIDIGMPWDDYCRFLELAPSALPEGYSLHDSTNTPGMSVLWAKVFVDGTRFIDENAEEGGFDQAIFLDILPFHKLLADEDAAWKQCRDGIFWQHMSYLHFLAHPKVPRTTSFRRLKELGCVVAHHTVARLFSPAFLRRRWEQVFDKPEDERGEHWMNASYTYNALIPTDVIFPVAEIDYDGMRVFAPRDVDAFLRIEYDDHYMDFPPEEDRYTHLPLVLDFGDGVNVMEGW